MSLYVVLSPSCPYFKKGAFIEDGDDGMMQEVEVRTENGRLIPGGFKGLCIPFEKVRPHVLRIQKLELDKSW